MISLNDSQYDLKNVKVFNGGDAGVVNRCTVRVERKTAADKENAPDYKLFLIDELGAEINKGYFTSKLSDKAGIFLVKEMKHFSNLFGFELPASIESYKSLLDISMKGIKDNCEGKKVNVFVSYGTTEYPNKYLQIAKGFDIVAENEKPYADPKALMVRIDPDTSVVKTEEHGNVLPFDAPNGAPAPKNDW